MRPVAHAARRSSRPSRRPRRAPALVLTSLAGLLLLAGMPGGWGLGPGFVVVMLGLLGAFVGYCGLLLASIVHAFGKGPNRVHWRVAALVLLALGTAVLWRIAG